MKATVEYRAEVEVEIPDDMVDRIIGPPVRNEDQDGNPIPYDPNDRESRGWRNSLYDLDTVEKVIDHLAYNSVFNSVDDISRLDGWADLTQEQAQLIRFSRVDVLDSDVIITEGEQSLTELRRQS